MTLFRIASPLLVLAACSDYDFIAKDEAPVGETGEPVALEAGIEVSPEFLSQTACTSVENSITVGIQGLLLCTPIIFDISSRAVGTIIWVQSCSIVPITISITI